MSGPLWEHDDDDPDCPCLACELAEPDVIQPDEWSPYPVWQQRSNRKAAYDLGVSVDLVRLWGMAGGALERDKTGVWSWWWAPNVN